MKIACDCRYFGKSGIGTFIESIVDELILGHPENRYLLVLYRELPVKWRKSNVDVLITDIKPFSMKELFPFPTKQINECDAFFTPYINVPGGIKIPIYTTIHDMVFFDVDGLVSPIGKIVRKLYYKRAIEVSKKIFTVSEFSKERILHHFPTKKEIIVGYNGVSHKVKESHFQTSSKENYFIYVGNIKRHKGLKTLLGAYSEATMRGLSSKLLIVGDSENFRTKDESFLQTLKSNPNIEFTGWVSDEKLIELISKAKALIQPSLYEGFGIPPLEALYLGTNVILSDIPVFKEIYDGLPVTFFKVGDDEDLSEKLLTFKEFCLPDEIQDRINKTYSYGIVTNTIIQTIEKDLI